MPGQNPLLLKWQEHFNSSWAAEDSTQTASRNGASALYNRLLHNKEVVTITPPVQELIGPRLPDFECESCASAEKDEYLTSLLHSQRWLTHRMLTRTSYNCSLQHRLVVLQRIFHALHNKYHDKFRTHLPSQGADTGPQNGQVEMASELFLPAGSCKVKMGTDVLIEMGVRTGLSLLFSLLQQNWRFAASVPPESMLCNDVLSTALSVLASLPPLSLANENKIPSVGLDCLAQVGDFLKKTSVNAGAGGADVMGRRLSLELLLGLAMQRGSLRYLLEWVEVALATSQSCSSCNLQQSVSVGFDVIHLALHQMRQFSGIRVDSVNAQVLKKDPEGFCHLSQAALCLLEEVCSLASHCLCSCNTDVMQTPDSDTVMVYVWGSNSSHQLAEGTLEKILLPKLTQGFSDAQMIEAGQYCTFSVSEDGSVKACGKGSYGRLGLGDSNNQSIPKKLVLEPHRNMKKVSSSKGSDGHTLAITAEGEVFSWGDGEYGKLGHGNSATQKYPKIIQGPLVGKGVVCVSAGYRHSAAVTCDGELYTWGEGDFGRLGHSDSQSRNVPTLVKDISGVGQVACGSSHTIAVAQDGRTVWSFGGGDNGKLGHGDTNRVYRPKVIEALQGFIIRKVCAGSQSSLALTSAGQVFAWGCGSCLGCGSSETTSLRPRFIEDLSVTKIIDISCGDSHCLALSHVAETGISSEDAAKTLEQQQAAPCTELQVPANHNQEEASTDDQGGSRLYLSVLESFMATREAMHVQQNVTVYESFGTSRPEESPGSPALESNLEQNSDKHQSSEQSLSYHAACHLVVSRCLFLLLGVRAAWVEPSEREASPTTNSAARNAADDSWLFPDGQKHTGQIKNKHLCLKSSIALPLCSLGVMKEAWDRLRQCMGPTTSLTHDGSNTSFIVNQVFDFVCGSLVHVPDASSTWCSEQTCALADPKAITSAILQQQQRAEMRLEALRQMSSFLSKLEEKGNGVTCSTALLQSVQLQFLCGCFGLGTHVISFHTGADYETQHYMTGICSASIDTQRALQSAAHKFYQQVVCTLRQRVILEKENPGSCQHLLLASMFALNFCYQPLDLALVIKCGILEVLSLFTNNSCYQMSQCWFAASAPAHALLSGAVKLACGRLLQILIMAASSCEDSLPIEISIELMEVMCEQLRSILSTFQLPQATEKGTGDSQDLNSLSAEKTGLESSRVVESQLADFLVFWRRVLSSRVVRGRSMFVKCVEPLLAIISHKSSTGSPCSHSLRTQLLAFHILEKVLPACSEADQIQKIVKQLFQLLSVYMWEEPVTEKKHGETLDVPTRNPGGFEECIAIGEFSFDPNKLICCTLESGSILSHGAGGKGYGLATTAITSGCFIWKDDSSATLLCEHLYLLLPCAAETINRSTLLIKQSLMDQKIMNRLQMVLYNSVSGSLLCQIMYSLLLLPLSTVQPLLSHLLVLLESLNNFTKVLPETSQQEEQELNVECQITGSNASQNEEKCLWVWLLDLERSVALAVGRCLGGMLLGPPPSLQEKESETWLSNVLLRNGLELDFEQLGSNMVWLTEEVLLGASENRMTEFSLSEETRVLLELALGSDKGVALSLWQNLEEYAHSREWESGGFAGDSLLQTVCRCSLAVLLKHTGMQDKAYWKNGYDPCEQLMDVYEAVYKIRKAGSGEQNTPQNSSKSPKWLNLR
uniref:RCC1-like domain-containing protein n=1 Tax=Knipowitschia caucasica TaxID=637954 RepID=A0AAV2IR35_KNICA